MNNVSRRRSIGAAASFGAFQGCRFAAVPGFRKDGKPNLAFGVVSDLHIDHAARSGEFSAGWGNELTFLHTLEWFRNQGVDAVVIAGDMTENGFVDQLQVVADAWNQVFPGNRAPDGRPVEKLFVYGNHDVCGTQCKAWYWFEGLEAPSEAELAKRLIETDIKKSWEKVFEEAYEPIWRKTVKGYDFVGVHWISEPCKGFDEAFNDGIAEYYATRRFDPARPFFHIQHPHLKDTVYGSWAWGRDTGLATQALAAHPNAIAFSGHSHYSITDERSIWQGAFTSVGTGSLRYTGLTFGEREGGFENSGAPGPDAWRVNAKKMLGVYENGDCRQGMLWRVYDDCVTVRKREFLSDLDLGDDWVLPLPSAEPKPFSFVQHAKKTGAPQFPKGAKLLVRHGMSMNRGGSGGDESIPAVRQKTVHVEIPAALAERGARAHSYRVTARSASGEVVKHVLATGYNHALEHRKATSCSECQFAFAELPKGPITFSVVPLNCFGKAGEPLEITF